MADSVVVPDEPSSSCFTKADFLKDNFSVDNFVASSKGSVSLESLKTTLDVYLKALKHALIELINQDYADFVNLSTILVGMDKSIANLSVPLGQLKEEVLLIKTALDGTIDGIEDKLNERALLRKKKTASYPAKVLICEHLLHQICMQHLLNITKSLEKIERLLSGVSGEEETIDDQSGSENESHLIERVAIEFNQLQFYVTQSQGHPLVESIRGRIAAITSTLQRQLECAFQEGIQTGQLDILSRVLRTYAIIDKSHDAELLFREVVVKPYMVKVIDEKELVADPVEGLGRIYGHVLEFVPRHCAPMMNITAGQFASKDLETIGEHRSGIRGFDFLVNAVWPEVVQLILTRLGSIFAPGNPDAFHQKYSTSMEFVSSFERLCGSKASVRRLRSHASFTAFMERWSLPVYFQIRFQEIVGKFETALQHSQEPVTTGDGQRFRTVAASVLWWALERCWDDSVYVHVICHRFWKLTLQLLSRFREWTRNELGRESSANAANGPSPTISMSFLVYLSSDINSLVSQVPDSFSHTILPKLKTTGLGETDLLRDALLEACDVIDQLRPEMDRRIVSHVVSVSCQSLDSAKNIPRQYRRTNREAPSKASSFVAAVMKPVREFFEEHRQLLGTEEKRRQWAVLITNEILQRYCAITSEVLTSIKRTEDSLLRLKRTRKQSGAVGAGSAETPTTISDDDKIRLQFALDVEEFGQMMRSLGVADTPAFAEVAGLVQAARSSPATPAN